MPPPLVPLTDLEATWSALWAYGVAGIVLGGLLARSIHGWVVHRNNRRASDAIERSGGIAARARGLTSVVGVVEADDQKTPISLRIEQSGTEWETRRGWGHAWTEWSRQIDARPFRLRTRDGESVQIIPDKHIDIVAPLREGPPCYEENTRYRVADVKLGDEVCVTGVLEAESRGSGVYRGGGSRATLRPAKDEPLLVEARPFGARDARKERFYAKATKLLGALFLAIHVLGYGTYHLVNLAGTEMLAEPRGTKITHTRTKSGSIPHYMLTARFRDASGRYRMLEGEVDRETYDKVRKNEIQGVPFLVVPWAPGIHLAGLEPHTSMTAAMMTALMTIVAFLGFFAGRVSNPPWYEQKRVRETGNGQLPRASA